MCRYCLSSCRPAAGTTGELFRASLTVLAGLAAGVAAIGTAKLAPAAIAVGYKWFKAAIFG
ncbi:hypothetical protein NJF45_10760 [Stenotrophomonas maltophilia]|nr:hypothetical protein [Stenotrophomonas maltophilia]MCO7462386.1 hypothetical protein [Stenotrophomonas maltophilia]